MKNANYSTISNSVNELSKQTFGQGGQFIVDDSTPSPTGLVFYYVTALTDVSGFSASNDLLHVSSGDYPVDIIAGTEFPAGLYNITVTGGSLMCLYN